MKRIVLSGAVAIAALSLAACASNGYSNGYGYGRSYYPAYADRGYSSWYDGWYGSVRDGYWGNGGVYYYRTVPGGRYYRDDGRHFRRGDRQPGEHFRRHDDGDRGRDHDRGRRGWRHDRD